MFCLCLNANAIWLLDVATNNCPDHTGREHETSSVTNKDVALVHGAVEELHRLWQLVIKFECSSNTQQDEEAEVDERVHHSCSTITKEGAHVHTCAVVSETTLCILRSCLTTIRCTALPVTHAICEAEGAPDQHDGKNCVEGSLDRTRDSFKNFAGLRRLVVPLCELGDDSRHHGERTHSDAQGNRQLVRTEALWRLLGGGCCVRAHNGDNASAIRVSEPTPVVDNGVLDPKKISRRRRGRAREREWRGP